MASLLIRYAHQHGSLLAPDPGLCAEVTTILRTTDPDPWSWVLSQIADPCNAVRVLNIYNDQLSSGQFPRSFNELLGLFSPSLSRFTVSTIAIQLHHPTFSFAAAASTPMEDVSARLVYARIHAPGVVLGPLPGCAPLCTTTETQLIGHRLPGLLRLPRTAFSLASIESTLSSLEDLFICMVAPGMAFDTVDDIALIIVHLDTSVHISQAWHRLAGA
ncbi:hypothetical protein V8E36_000922 [Tilletia maclaganii]